MLPVDQVYRAPVSTENIANRSVEGKPDIPPVEPTPVSERTYDADDLYSGGADGTPSAADIDQNSLGDCFFIATAGAVADQTPDRIKDAISYNEDTGNFTVRLYDGDDWREIEVSQADIQDNIDRGGGSRLDGGTGSEPIWPAVMEAAYAKLRGGTLDEGYKKLDEGGKARDAMETITGSDGDDLSGGLVGMIGMDNAYQIVNDALENGRPVTLSTDPEETANWFTGFFGDEDSPQDGLADNHVYVVNDIYKNSDGEVMVQLRNPWQTNNSGSVGETTDANSDSAFITVKLEDIVKGQGLEYFNIGPGT